MHPRRVITSTVVVAAVGVLTAVTIPALAGTDQTSNPPAPALDAEPAPELLAAMQRDLGLTDQQAQERLTQEAWASGVTAALSGELGDRYAGAWLTEDAEALMVAVTDEGAAAQVRAAGAEPTVVAHGASELAATVTTMDSYAEQAADSIAGWYVDVASNTVVVVAPAWAEADAREFVADAGMAGDMVRVVASDEQPRLLEDVRGGDAYFIDDAARCSIGFSVVGGFVTAGHCNLAGTTTSGFDGEAQGEFVASSFPGAGLGGQDDWGVVAVNEDWIPQPVVNDFADGTLPVAGSEEAPVGASVCKYGSTTGVSCGVVEATNVSVIYPEGIVAGLTRTDACAEPGDSGGSWLAGDQAQGVTSGGSGNCTVGGTTFFQPVNEILEVNDLTLVTTGAAEE
jgi:streptogrisin C